jgi:predicted DsbA family dithiol-disulfide isomerase
MQIDIVFDMCAFCFMAKRQLAQALAMRPEIRAEITWRAFQLNPDLPPEGMDRDLFFQKRFGSVATGRRVYETVVPLGLAVGIPFAFDRIRRTPNTRDAHRLLRYARARGKEDLALEAVFTAYFVEGRDVGDARVLAQIAGEIGLDADEALDFLANSAELEQVLTEDRDARRSGISVVPVIVFNRRYALPGAHEPETLLPLIDAAEREGLRRD